jgi:hypothetical protein
MDPSLDLDQYVPGRPFHVSVMPEKPCQPKKESKPSRLAEMQQNLEDHARDLREIIKKLREALHRAE